MPKTPKWVKRIKQYIQKPKYKRIRNSESTKSLISIKSNQSGKGKRVSFVTKDGKHVSFTVNKRAKRGVDEDENGGLGNEQFVLYNTSK